MEERRALGLSRPQQPPGSEQNFLAPSPGSPTSWGPGLGSEGAAGVGGKAGPPSECSGPGPDGRGAPAGGGGIWNSPGGPNVVTMASVGWTGSAGQSERDAAALGLRRLPMRDRVVGWAGPPLEGPGDPPPSARRYSELGGWGAGKEVRSKASRGRGRAEGEFLEGVGAGGTTAQCEKGVGLGCLTVLIVRTTGVQQARSPSGASVFPS